MMTVIVYNEMSIILSCPDVTDDRGRTPLDVVTEESISWYFDQDEREKVINYLKSVQTERSELLLNHSFLSVLTCSLYIRYWSKKSVFGESWEKITSIKTTSKTKW